MLGVRDVFQQLTAASIWNKNDVRRKIILCLNYIMSNGRAPRQFTIPAAECVIPKFNIRQFIDQGIWIIETLHKYISRTGDYSILNEKCSYYEIIDEKKGVYKKSNITDTVLDHLIKITDYLNSNTDESNRAWEQIMKILPLTHKNINKTPFVMPNSYCCNEEFQIDGDSSSDWYTGSGAVLYRCIYEYALGIRAGIYGVEIASPDYLPFDSVTAETVFKGKNVKFIYTNKNQGERKYFLNGALQEVQLDEVSGYKTLFIKNDEIKDNMIIEVTD